MTQLLTFFFFLKLTDIEKGRKLISFILEYKEYY